MFGTTWLKWDVLHWSKVSPGNFGKEKHRIFNQPMRNWTVDIRYPPQELRARPFSNGPETVFRIPNINFQVRVLRFREGISEKCKVVAFFSNQRTVILFTLPETNRLLAPENRPLEKEIPIGNQHFQGLLLSVLGSVCETFWMQNGTPKSEELTSHLTCGLPNWDRIDD